MQLRDRIEANYTDRVFYSENITTEFGNRGSDQHDAMFIFYFICTIYILAYYLYPI